MTSWQVNIWTLVSLLFSHRLLTLLCQSKYKKTSKQAALHRCCTLSCTFVNLSHAECQQSGASPGGWCVVLAAPYHSEHCAPPKCIQMMEGAQRPELLSISLVIQFNCRCFLFGLVRCGDWCSRGVMSGMFTLTLLPWGFQTMMTRPAAAAASTRITLWVIFIETQ